MRTDAVARENEKQRFLGRTIPLVLASFALAFVGVLVIDLYIEHRQITASTHIAGSTISLLDTVSDFERSVDGLDGAAAHGARNGRASATLKAAQSRLDAAMGNFEEHLGAEDRPPWHRLRGSVAAFDGTAPIVDDLSQVVAIVDRRGLAAIASAERLHMLEGTLEACLLFLLGAASVALLFGWRRREALARSRDAQIEDQLRRAVAELEGFAGRVAHDLRNPLSPILAGSQWIEHAPVTGAVRGQAERIERAARRLGRTIDALLQYTRAMGARAPEGALTPVNAAVEEIIADFDEQARARGARLETDFGPQCTLPCVPEVVQSIVGNLVDNALKYASAGDTPARVVVRTRVEPPFCVLEVEDNGPGIPAEQRQRVFEPLFRGQTGGAGIGLGLSIVQRLVDAQRGRIELLSGEQGGALFRVLLPMDRASRAEAARAIASPPPA
jgi:signal transduction histidine kinase